jgi:hypothetical protein
MTQTVDTVRPSRDGDQFHYFWAARRCLTLLDPKTDLVAVSIEGISESEEDGRHGAAESYQVVDVAEYFGSTLLSEARLVRYVQLKHSTRRKNKAWTFSELTSTWKGFVKRFEALRADGPSGAAVVRMVLETNRPISPSLSETVEDLSTGATERHPRTATAMRGQLQLSPKRLKAFCNALELVAGVPDYQAQRVELARDLRGFIVARNPSLTIDLKELITRKALSESADDRTIRKTDVLAQLDVEEHDLFPAPSRLESPTWRVERSSGATIAGRIVEADSPVLVHASGGFGKSDFAVSLTDYLPAGSTAVIYDCFGDADYLRGSSPRHRHEFALVQIANELAARGLCLPLIRTSTATDADYVRGLWLRLDLAARELRQRHPQALVLVVIDAADNAAIAGSRFAERPFVKDLLREPVPDGVRLVLTCRTGRIDRLDPPPTLRLEELPRFSMEETGSLLRHSFPDATKVQVEEFHALTSQNPRMQVKAVALGGSLEEVLISLGPEPMTVDDLIESQVDRAIDAMLDHCDEEEVRGVGALCTALALLPPRIPLDVLFAVSGMPEAAVRSFASDLGRSLLVKADAVQFRDEPTETWFRERFGSTGSDLGPFVDRLLPLAEQSVYAAAALPSLMLEAGRLSDLVTLVLEGGALPECRPVERRDVVVQRLQTALKAALRQGEHSAAAKLALQAAEEAAGDERQRVLVQENTDLAAALLEPEYAHELVSRRRLGGGWRGARYVHEAALLAPWQAHRGEANSRLRTAHSWLRHWSELSDDERDQQPISRSEIAELIMAHLGVHGPGRAMRELRRWKPRDLSFDVGLVMMQRFADQGLYDKIDAIVEAAGNDFYVVLAASSVLRRVGRRPPDFATKRAMRLLLDRRVPVDEEGHFGDRPFLSAVTALVSNAVRAGSCDHAQALAALARVLPAEPSHELTSRYSQSRYAIIGAYALQAVLRGEEFTLLTLAPPRIREELEAERTTESSETRQFREDLQSLLPWYTLWSEVALGVGDVSNLEQFAANNLPGPSDHFGRERWGLRDQVAKLWAELSANQEASQEARLQFTAWVVQPDAGLWTTTLTSLAWTAARTEGMEPVAYRLAQRSADHIAGATEPVDSKVSTYVALARALLGLDREEAAAYLDRAIEMASKLGDEVFDRWEALLGLTSVSAGAAPALAYRLGRCAEVAQEFLHKHFDWGRTAAALAALDGSSALAILSRWWDRGIRRGELLPSVICYLVKIEELSPDVAVALMWMKGGWPVAELAKALDSSPSGSAEATELLVRLVALEEIRPRVWRDLSAVLDPDCALLSEYGKRREYFCSIDDDSDSQWVRPEAASVDWESVFEGVDVGSAEQIEAAYSRYRAAAPYRTEDFWYEAVSRVPAGREVAFIEAAVDVGRDDSYMFRQFIEAVPEVWLSRLAAAAALREAVFQAASRHCLDITRNRHYQPLPIDRLAQVADMDEQEVADAALTALGQRSEPLEVGRLYSLVGLLRTRLSPDEAMEVLDFGVALFEANLDDEDGDGPVRDSLLPAADLEAAVAGYLWSALSAPQGHRRWEAAHAVRSLCELGCERVITHLIALDRGEPAGPYSDDRLPFYHMHGRLWLLIAFARVAAERPTALVSETGWLKDRAFCEDPHVLIRHFASSAIRMLQRAGVIELTPDEEAALAETNRSPHPIVASGSYVRPPEYEGPPAEFSFGYDFERYSFEGLARCFNVAPEYARAEASKVIVDEWEVETEGKWLDDPRARRQLYDDGETSHSHGSRPRTDSLSFYLSFHAMMVTAGRLLQRHPLIQQDYETVPEFELWVGREVLTRADGRWVLDHRSPQPVWAMGCSSEGEDDEWPWSIQRTELDGVIGLESDHWRLWGRWRTRSGWRTEEVEVRSALVTPETGPALVRALQGCEDPHQLGLPMFADEWEIERDEYQLTGWVMHSDSQDGLDELDLWAADIRYPSPAPSPEVFRDLKQVADSDGRAWTAGVPGTAAVLSSLTWGGEGTPSDRYDREEGHVLIGAKSFICQQLSTLGKDLIVKTTMRRTLKHQRIRMATNEFGYVPPYFRVLLLKANGERYSL